MNRTAALARPVCAACERPVHHYAKSHRHYTHLVSAGCPIRKVEAIRMQVLKYRDEA